MKMSIPFGREVLELSVDLPEQRVIVAKSKAQRGTNTIEELVREALDNPIGAKRIRDNRLRGKKVAILVDDKTRPTPARRIVSLVLDELKKAGSLSRDVFFVIATGLHTLDMPLPVVTEEQQIEEKLGREIPSKYSVLTHDAYKPEKLQFIGFSKLGTPIWVNKDVFSADYRIAIGRICPHGDCGYEGGGKMVLPGISSLETVMHNHRMFCSPNTGAGTLDENPGRVDADDVGKIVGLDFILNIVCGRSLQSVEWVKGFAGDCLGAHRCGVEFGDKNVWGVAISEKADITIVSPGSGGIGSSYLHYAQQGTKPGGTVIYLAGEERPEVPMSSPPRWFFVREELRGVDLEETIRRQQQFKLVKPEDIFEMERASAGVARRFNKHQNLVRVVGNSGGSEVGRALEKAVSDAIKKHRRGTRVLVLPEGETTLPLVRFHEWNGL